MPRRPYVYLGGVWPFGFAPQPAHFRKLDQFSSELVNGEDGGTWEPEEPIILGPFGGAPAATVALTTSGSILSGNVETVLGNEDGDEVNQPGLVLQSGAVPTFQSARSRIVTVGFTNAFYSESGTAQNVEPYFVERQTLAGVLGGSGPAASRMHTVVVPIRGQHRGATIAQVDFRIIVAASSQATLPVTGNAARFRIAKVVGDTTVFLHDNTSGYDANGWLIDPAATAAAWHNNGQVRTIPFVPNQNHTNIDPSTSWFMVQMRPAFGMAVGTMLLSATITLTGIADYRQE